MVAKVLGDGRAVYADLDIEVMPTQGQIRVRLVACQRYRQVRPSPQLQLLKDVLLCDVTPKLDRESWCSQPVPLLMSGLPEVEAVVDVCVCPLLNSSQHVVVHLHPIGNADAKHEPTRKPSSPEVGTVVPATPLEFCP